MYLAVFFQKMEFYCKAWKKEMAPGKRMRGIRYCISPELLAENAMRESGEIKKARLRAGLFVYAFLLMQLRSSNATSRRLIKASSPLRNQTRGS
jgi:hypothetical protein